MVKWINCHLSSRISRVGTSALISAIPIVSLIAHFLGIYPSAGPSSLICWTLLCARASNCSLEVFSASKSALHSQLSLVCGYDLRTADLHAFVWTSASMFATGMKETMEAAEGKIQETMSLMVRPQTSQAPPSSHSLYVSPSR